MKKLLLGAIVYVLVGAHGVNADSWRILFYMDSIENLNDMAIKAVTEMMCAQPTDTVEFYIQLPAYSDKGLRYRLDNQKLSVDSEVIVTGDAKQDLLDAAAWGFAGLPADQNTPTHTMLMVSNYGGNILDSDLGASLQQIKEEILQGRAVDILAFDTCMGAMLEVAYQVAPYAHYLVGSQSCSLPDGFDYKGVIAVLNQEQNSPEAVAAGMMRAFDTYYTAHDAPGISTHAALDLSQIEPVIQAINSLMVLLLALPDRVSLLQAVRDQTPRFCMLPLYTDLVAFCDLIEHQLRASDTRCDSVDISRILYGAIYEAINNIRLAVNNFTAERCAGAAVAGADAHGCAVYCPPAHIDSSYRTTLFAQTCRWYQALQVMCQEPVRVDSACVRAIRF